MKTILNNHVYLLESGNDKFFALSHFEPWEDKTQLISFITSIERVMGPGYFDSWSEIKYAVLKDNEMKLLTKKYQVKMIGELSEVCRRYKAKEEFDSSSLFADFLGKIVL